MRVEGTHCCHIVEFIGLNDNAWNLEGAIEIILEECDFDDGQPLRGAVMFTVAWDPKTRNVINEDRRRPYNKFIKRYNSLCDFVLENQLGTITKVPAAINPNHGSKVKVGIWNFDQQACSAYCENNDIGNADNNNW